MNDAAGRVGIIGLGMMGDGIARSLIDRNFDCVVHDIRNELRESEPVFADRWCASPREVAEQSDVVFIVVVTADQAQTVLSGVDGLLAAGRSDLVVCLCCTVDLEDVRRLYALAQNAHVALLDVGIAGGPDAAAGGTLVTTVGGDSSAFDHAHAALDAISTRTLHVGPTGAGMSLKLLKNALSFSVMSAVHECLAMGELMGFDPDLIRTVTAETNLVDHFFWFPMSRPSAFASRDTPDSAVAAARHFATIAAKDLSAAISLADEIGAPHQELDLAKERVDSYFLLTDPREG